jgi:kynureninase
MNPSTTGHDPLLAWREEFPTVEATLHFASHTLGAMPRGVEEALRRYVHLWRSRGIRAWEEEWFRLPMETADVLASILAAEPGTVTMFENVTIAQAVALSGVGFTGPRNRLVCTMEDFPSVLYLYEGLARRGAEVARVHAKPAPGAPPGVPPRHIEVADLVAAIDERTAVVALSHVLFRTAELLDLEPVVRRAHECGALVLVDAYQSVGTVPVDVGALDLDLVTGGSVKWLCGGPGAGWLYVRPDLAERLEPTFVGWQGHARPFAFEPELEYAPGVRRFLTGTPNVPALYAASAGYDVIEEVGVERIRERSLALTQLLIDLLDEAGLEVASPREPARRGGTVLVRTPDHAAVHRELGERGIICDFRPDAGVRLGPHFYNTEDELRHTVEQLAEIVSSGAYARHSGVSARF